MKSMLLTAMLLLSVLSAWAQTDPTIITIDGKPVSRSEFEYSYNKNNSEMVVDKKSVAEYVDLFINYKLKVLAAEEAGIDTTQSFKKEFLSYRDQQIRQAFLSNDDLKREAWKIYVETRDRIDSMGGMVRPSHILVRMSQKATKEQEAAAKTRIDSIYKAIAKGADFADVKSIMADAGYAHMGVGVATGRDKAEQAARAAINSPLIETSMENARGIIISITGSDDIGLEEVELASSIITDMAHPDATIIWGAQLDDTLEDTIRVTVVATGLGDDKKDDKKDDLASLLGGNTDDDESYTDVISFFNNKD